MSKNRRWVHLEPPTKLGQQDALLIILTRHNKK